MDRVADVVVAELVELEGCGSATGCGSAIGPGVALVGGCLRAVEM